MRNFTFIIQVIDFALINIFKCLNPYAVKIQNNIVLKYELVIQKRNCYYGCHITSIFPGTLCLLSDQQVSQQQKLLSTNQHFSVGIENIFRA